ncbi:prolipoprotein diacylglyceryl transferase [Candidatus Gracilibacteria bacterium GN02-872]|nr:prolipoprotein diacylglyceryl transferase [Candidatus Gracilibacteria bacterium GN02-872]RKW24995.1 MAG: prolipoprotein diacylglyceryl transferase [Candidatus Gracilibacteria bacterium]
MTIFELKIFGITIAPTYYGLMYAIGLLFGYFVFIKRGIFSKEKVESLFIYVFLGVLLGGRLGYVLFYNLSDYLANPLSIINVTEGGMSFHGGVIGVLIAMFLFSKIHKENFFVLGDEIVTVLPVGLFLGRIGNYLNKELLGFAGYNGPLAIEKGGISYFPSPLLEAFLEGIVLYFILNFIYRKKKFKAGQVGALFLVFYATFRIFVEMFFRTPDSQIGYIFGVFTMGEILSFPMFFLGIILFFVLGKNEKKS